MGSIISAFVEGFSKVVSNLFGAPLDFLSGKSCSSVCESTWDFICYIDNFCIANLLKMAMVLALLYIVLLFFYLLYKTGICYCIGRSLCKMIWACLASCFYALEHCCTFLCFNTRILRQKNRAAHITQIEEYYSTDDDLGDDQCLSYHNIPRYVEPRMRSSSLSHRTRENCRRVQFQRSLRPRSHRIRVGISRNAVYMNKAAPRQPFKHGKHGSTVHNVKVTQTSKFVRKGGNVISSTVGAYQKRRW